MNKFKKYVLTFLVFTIVVSCKTKPESLKAEKATETPDALQPSEINISKLGYRNDLLEELYKELVAKSPELTKLEDDLETLQLKTKQTTAEFEGYDRKSKDYYSSASSLAASINDSLLKKRIEELVLSNKLDYAKSKAKYTSLIKEITNGRAKLDDQHSALKVLITLPVIESFQKEHSPKLQPYREIVSEQKKLIEKSKGLEPE